MPNSETSTTGLYNHFSHMLVQNVAKMGHFCPILDLKVANLTLFLRGFCSFEIRLNIQEVRMQKIPNVFYFVPSILLDKSGIKWPFSSILDWFSGHTRKSGHFRQFLAISAKMHALSQIAKSRNARNDPFLTLQKPTKQQWKIK